MSFSYRKVYADLVTPAGDVMVLYLSWLDAWRLRQARAALELYPAGGRRQVCHAHVCPPEPDTDQLQRGWRVELAGDWGRAHLSFDDGAAGWSPGGAPLHPRLDWRVLTLRCRASLEGPVAWRGWGYADRVELRAPPRLLGLRSLAWGRAHTADSAAVHVSCATPRRGSRPLRAWHTGGGVRETDAGEECDWSAATVRRLHRGPALDRARFPGWWDRTLARALAGPIQEERCLDWTPVRALLCERVAFSPNQPHL